MNKKRLLHLNNEKYSKLRKNITPGELYRDKYFGCNNKAVFYSKIDYAKQPLQHAWYRPRVSKNNK